MIITQLMVIILSILNVKALEMSSNYVEPCAPNQDKCQNGGFCVVLFGVDISCTCPVGFTGKLCETRENTIVSPNTLQTTTNSFSTVPAVAPCSNIQDKCQNDGFCVNIFGIDVSCTCKVGFTGEFCEIRENGKMALISTATATQLFFAPVAVSPCSTSQDMCQNGGFCVVLFGIDVSCTCRVGFTGSLCEIVENTVIITNPAIAETTTTVGAVVPCVPSQDKCQNGGFCVVIFGRDIQCTCRVGFTGSLCEIVENAAIITNPTKAAITATVGAVVPCVPSQDRCQNGGFCVVIFGRDIQCTCRVGFTGSLCEIIENAPITNPTIAAITTTVAAVVPCVPSQDRCQNGGFCVVIFGREVQCTCRVGFTGQFCEIIENQIVFPSTATTTTTPLVSSFQPCPVGTAFCQNGGLCLILNGNEFICSCLQDYTGTFCEIPPLVTMPPVVITTVAPIDPCPSSILNPCLNGGECLVIEKKDFICACRINFTGLFCETPVNAPLPLTIPCPFNQNPCLNVDALCLIVTETNVTNCICPQGFSGAFCEISTISECNPSIASFCENGATCYINGTTINCVCPVGFTGFFCENKLSIVQPGFTTCPTSILDICQNGGTCLLNGSIINCICQTDYTGSFCETQISIVKPVFSACSPIIANICQNGAACLSNGVIINCFCPAGFTGPFCSEKPSICLPDPCFDGECIPNADNTDFECRCDPGFYGLFCETQSCNPSPCKNGNACVNGLIGPRCLCLNGYSGMYCEDII